VGGGREGGTSERNFSSSLSQSIARITPTESDSATDKRIPARVNGVSHLSGARRPLRHEDRFFRVLSLSLSLTFSVWQACRSERADVLFFIGTSSSTLAISRKLQIENRAGQFRASVARALSSYASPPPPPPFFEPAHGSTKSRAAYRIFIQPAATADSRRGVGGGVGGGEGKGRWPAAIVFQWVTRGSGGRAARTRTNGRVATYSIKDD
jgi:hypothetical protein